MCLRNTLHGVACSLPHSILQPEDVQITGAPKGLQWPELPYMLPQCKPAPPWHLVVIKLDYTQYCSCVDMSATPLRIHSWDIHPNAPTLDVSLSLSSSSSSSSSSAVRFLCSAAAMRAAVRFAWRSASAPALGVFLLLCSTLRESGTTSTSSPSSPASCETCKTYGDQLWPAAEPDETAASTGSIRITMIA